MDRTAGFAASIAIRQELIQSLVRVLYNASGIATQINVAAPTVSANLFLSLPVLSYPPASGNRLAIDLYAWGPMTVTPPGGTSEPRRVKFRAHVLVAQTVSIANGRLVFGLESSTAAISNIQIDPYTGGLFSPQAVAYLLSPQFQLLVTLGLQAQIGALGQLIPPLDISFLGSIATDPSTTVRFVTVDEALVLGLDINSAGVTTHGNVDALSDISAGNHIGMWTRPSVVPVAYPDVRAQIEAQVAQEDAALDQFSISVAEGWFLVAGKGVEDRG